MSSTPEGKVKKKLDVWIKANMPGAFVFKIPGGMFGRAGMPDYLIIHRGVPIVMEVKADKTKQLTVLQRKILGLVIQAGGIGVAMMGFEYDKLNALLKFVDERAQKLGK